MGSVYNWQMREGAAMSIWVTGDIHGSIDIKKLSHRRWPEGRMLTSEDQLIICGDFGMPWDGSNEEKYWLGWLCDRPWTTLFVDGNHECFPYLAELPESERWGGRVQVYPDYPGIVHLMRGEVYDIGGARIFAMGGAASHDKAWRTPGWDWFAEEMPSASELGAAEDRLEAVDWQVDYVVSHCCSTRMLDAALARTPYPDGRDMPDALNEWLDMLEDRLTYRRWYFGHYHADVELDGRHRLLYRDIVELGR